MVKILSCLLACGLLWPFPAAATVTFCEDLTAKSLLEVQEIIGIRDFPDYLGDQASSQELDLSLLRAIEAAEIGEPARARLLVAASQLNLVETVRYLAGSTKDLNWRLKHDEFSVTALFVSAWCGNREVVGILLDRGASPTVESCLPFGGYAARTCAFPIFAAVAGGRFEGGDPRLVCAIARNDCNGGLDWASAKSSTGQTVWDFVVLTPGHFANSLSAALRGDCRGLDSE